MNVDEGKWTQTKVDEGVIKVDENVINEVRWT